MAKIDSYFMTRDAPGDGIKRVDLKKVRPLLIGLGLMALAVIFALPNEERKISPAAVSATSVVQPRAAFSGSNRNGDFYVSSLTTARGTGSFGYGARQRGASQLVKSEDGTFGYGLKSGTSMLAKTVNRIVTSEARSPVIAVLTQGSSEFGLNIEAGTKILGNADANSSSDRVQVLFHTLSLPSGREIPINAVAVMPDGSSGIAGDYHSQMMKKEGGRLLSHFAAGFANGLKDRQPGGVFPFEPGNLKNAALGGVVESATEQSKAYGEELKAVRPFVSVEPDTAFVVFFEKGLKL